MGMKMAGKKDTNKLAAFFAGFADTEESLDFRMANQVLTDKIEVISTGSPGLDDALSCGGYPKGRIIQLYGTPGSGKSFLSMIAIKEAQKEPGSQQMFIDAEGTFSALWAETIGIDLSRVIVIDGDTAVNGRKCFEMLLGTPKEDKQHILVGKSKEGLLDNITNKTFNINLIVLDSLGAIQPPGEDTSAIGKMNMSLLARFLTTTLRKLSLEVKKANIPFIIINHKRDNMDPYGASDHTFAGGNSYGHFLSANIYFDAVQRKDAQILDDKEQKIGHPIRAVIEKSKFGAWPRRCEFKINFSQGIVERHEEIAALALKYNLVEKPTNLTYQYGDIKWVGMNKFCEALVEDPKLLQEIEEKIVSARAGAAEAKRTAQSVKIAENE
jgi:recombination protein RecA